METSAPYPIRMMKEDHPCEYRLPPNSIMCGRPAKIIYYHGSYYAPICWSCLEREIELYRISRLSTFRMPPPETTTTTPPQTEPLKPAPFFNPASHLRKLLSGPETEPQTPKVPKFPKKHP